MIVILNFSNKENGNCQAIVKTILKNNPDKDLKVFDFSKITIKPCGFCNYQCLKEKQLCPIKDDITSIYNLIFESEFTLFIIPNYCGYPNSNYFIFNERGCGIFNKDKLLLEKYLKVNKKFIVISNTSSENFKRIAYDHVNTLDLNFLMLSPKNFDKSSFVGNLMDSTKAYNLVLDFFNDIYQIEESAMAIVFFEDKILATNELVYEKMVLSLPKGHIEDGETHVIAAIRECFEETGVIISVANLVQEIDSFCVKFLDHNNSLIKKNIYPVVFKIDSLVDTIIKEEKIKDASFINTELFLKNCSYDNIKNLVKIALKII